FNSCNKDDDSSPENKLEDNYFTIEDADFVSKAFPDASTSTNAPVISSLYGNTSVLAGGSNPISIETASNISSILVGVDGEDGYFKLPASSLKSTQELYVFFLMMTQNLDDPNFTIIIAILGDDGLVSQHSTINVATVEAGTGKLQVNCTWDKANDVDLHLVEPSQEEIYYGYGYSSNGGYLDVDSNPACYIDGINNENITYGDDAIVENGQYIVRVDLYSNCDIANSTNYIVTAYYEGEIINAATGTNPYQGTFTSADEDYGDYGSGKTVMTFNIGSTKKSSVNEKLIKFTYAADKYNKIKNLSPQK
ncbi:MAG: hypothetical protein JXR51_14120, partial [Bacteroidales bacterium]|nr:hypothetical protein [Bacteroidales bacterium]